MCRRGAHRCQRTSSLPTWCDDDGATFDGHLLESETYVGGHVECLQTGIYRNDLPIKFRLVPEALQGLLDKLDDTLKFAIVDEGGVSLDEVTNYDEVRDAIAAKLIDLRDHPKTPGR